MNQIRPQVEEKELGLGWRADWEHGKTVFEFDGDHLKNCPIWIAEKNPKPDDRFKAFQLFAEEWEKLVDDPDIQFPKTEEWPFNKSEADARDFSRQAF